MARGAKTLTDWFSTKVAPLPLHSDSSHTSAGSSLFASGGPAWLIGFVIFFSTFDLPNNRPATRRDVWPLVPMQLLEIVWPLPEPDAPPSGWQFLPQRLPAIGVGLAIVGAGTGLGLLVVSRLPGFNDLTRSERLFFAGGAGLSLWSLLTLALGVAGALQPGVHWGLTLAGLAAAVATGRTSLQPAADSKRPTPAPTPLVAAALLVFVPMAWAMLLGACTPQVDFDVVEYHLNGPKEWFQRGRIAFLPHNIYTSFPFLTEMLLLSGMVLRNDVHAGALAGQVSLTAFSALAAVGLYAAGRRWFSPSAGWLAALVWLTTPWTYRLSIIAYAEGGLSFYVLASFLAAHEACARKQPAWFALTGFLSGSAMACKYPGLISVVVPVAVGCAARLWRQRIAWRSLVRWMSLYATGAALAVGPWLVKNGIETGNPVYPLAYSIFGGRDFDAETNVRWVRAHAAPSYASINDRLRDFYLRCEDVVANNDWHSPLLFGLAPLAFFGWRERRAGVVSAWLFVAWMFAAWFFLTHHIDRFWAPMIPVVALLAGGGAAAFATRPARIVGGLAIAACVAFNATICSLIGGYNAGLTDLAFAQRVAERTVTPELAWLNHEYAERRLPEDFKLLCVGEAATFHARFPVLYHTVFDRCLLEEWCAAGPGPDYPLKPAEEMRRALRERGVTHVFVNWREILRYREPGSYGYTDFAHPRQFRRLQEAGVLGAALSLPESLGLARLTDDRRKQLDAWAPELIVKYRGDEAYVSGQIFPVRGD